MNAQGSKLDLAVVLTAHDSMRTIERTLGSVQGLGQRTIVVDSGSEDGTQQRCRTLGAEVIHRAWTGHVEQKQFAIDQGRDHAWVLLLDSDEALEPALRESIERTVAGDDHEYEGWELNRKVFFENTWLHHCCQPEWRLRLVRGGRSRIVGRVPHDRMHVDGRVGRLAGDLRHDSWADLEDLCRRSLSYGRVSAEAGARGGGFMNLVISPPSAFFKQYVLKRGFLDGRAGLIVSGSAALGSLVKHLFIASSRLRERTAGDGTA